MGGKTIFVGRVEGGQIKICPGGGGVIKLVMSWGWRGYFCARGKNLVGVTLSGGKMCPEGGGGREKNMSGGWRGVRKKYVLKVGGPEIFCLPTPQPRGQFPEQP